MIDVKKFKEQGYILIPNYIPNDMVVKCKDECLSIKQSIVHNNLEGTKKGFGCETYWKGVDMASFLSSDLFEYYTSEFMFDIAKQLLETDNLYLFNDQVVVKLPNENFEFVPHTDNELGPNPSLAERGEFKTITCAWILDDFTVDNGPISILNKQTNEWDTPLPKKGDIVVWDGNTLHKSSLNTSNKERVIWLSIYSTHNLLKIDSTETKSFKHFYDIKFELGKMVPMTSTHKNKYTAQQTKDAWTMFEQFLLNEKFERVFEIGTGMGGLTQFIDDFSKDNKIDTEILTVDIKPVNESLINNNVKCLQLDVTNVQNLSRLDTFLRTNKKLLILCDGGNKPKEFNLFAKYIKVGDFIMAHDYAISYEYFENNIKNKKWDWCLISEGDIVNVCDKFNLIDNTNIDFTKEMWVCKTKKVNSKKTLL
jgi:cephalosporin hydroxylase